MQAKRILQQVYAITSQGQRRRVVEVCTQCAV